MNWRPENWDNPFGGIFSVPTDADYEAFEAGADAMLAALWKLAEESPTKTFTLDANVISIYRGE